MHDSGDYAADTIIDGTNKAVGSVQNISQPVGILYGVFFILAGGFFYLLESLVIKNWRVSFTNIYDSKGWTFLDYFDIGKNKGHQLKFKPILKYIGLIVLFAASFHAASTEIRYEPKLRFYPSMGVLSMKQDDQIFACEIPTIEYFKCAAGTQLDSEGNCFVTEALTPFNLEYKVNNAENCVGTGGTPSWQGPLAPFAGGSGVFTKQVIEGIDQTTEFGMSCNAQSSFHFKSVPITRSISLLPLLQHTLTIAAADQHYAVINVINGSTKFKPMNSFNAPKSRGEVGFLIRLIEDNIHLIPTTKGSSASIKIDQTGNHFKDEYSTWMMITNESMSNGNNLKQALAQPLDRGKCDSFVEYPSQANNAINITVVPDDESCYIDQLKEAYLTWYLLEKANNE